ncbi:MAG: peroxiredoxin family protein [Planctomycetota bacterium]|nr:peroxiredoxin family protein [Planctomycetota bacterium]
MAKKLFHGDPAPDFTLATPHGVEIALHASLRKGPAVLEFIRGTWDPAARARITELAEAKERLEELGGNLLIVSCEDPGSAGSYLDAGTCPFSLLADPAFEASEAFCVFQKFSWGAVNVARPASFIIDRCGFLRYCHTGSSPLDAAPLDELIGNLHSLQEEEGRTGSGGNAQEGSSPPASSSSRE